MRRFFRDTGILLAFCGTFYLLTVLVSRMEGDSSSDDSDFSLARKRANILVHKKDWPAAKVEFKKLTEQDPLNGYAWDSYATCIWEIRRTAMIAVEANLVVSNPKAVEKEQELQQQVADLDDQARVAYMRLKKFARYRRLALVRLAIVESDRGNYEEAMDFIEEFVERGYQTQRGLHWVQAFGAGTPPPIAKFANITRRYDFDSSRMTMTMPTGSDARLHLEPRFWDLVRRERETSLQF